MRLTAINRYQAALIHLALSAMVAAATFAVIYALWYPGALFEGAGGRRLFLLIAGVDVCLGPLLTLIVYAPGKKSLRFDLTVIALLQLTGLAYGVHVMFEARPAYIVFVRDRFELARANHIAPEELEKGRSRGFGELPLTGPRIVGSRLPTNPDEMQRLMMAAMAGVDVHAFPRYYVPYEDVRAEVLKASQPAAALRGFNAEAPAAVEREIAKAGRPEAQLRFLPMRSGKMDLTVFVDARDARVLHIAKLHPWQFR